MNPFPLFADIGGVLTAVIFVVFTLLSIVSQYLNKGREEVKRPPPRPQPPQPAGKPQTREGGPLADEIADFLERAQRRRSERPSGASPPPRRRPAPAEEPLVPEVIEAVSGEDVAQHVRDRFSAARFGTVGSTDLGQQVALSDDRLEARLHKVFDHQLGMLSSQSGETAEIQRVVEAANPDDRVDVSAGLAAQVAALLADPVTVRQAVLLSEIFNRPESRWR